MFQMKFKNSSGSILLQALIGLGVMVMMSPIIFREIKKYNEGVQRENVINDLVTLQHAASSFVTFDKDKYSSGICSIPLNSVKILSGDNLKACLQDYLPTASSALFQANPYEQTYSLVMKKIPNGTETNVVAVVVASGGTVDVLTLNGIGQYLFDKGVIVAPDKLVIGEEGAQLPAVLEESIKNLSGSIGAIVLFVSDVTKREDYLYANNISGDSKHLFNTMLTNLYMGGNNIANIKTIDLHDLILSESLYIKNLSVQDAVVKGAVSFSDRFNVANTVNTNSSFYIIPNNDIYFSSPVDVSGGVSVNYVNLPNSELIVNGNANVKNNIDVTGNVEFGKNTNGASVIGPANQQLNFAGNVYVGNVNVNTTANSIQTVGDLYIYSDGFIYVKRNSASETEQADNSIISLDGTSVVDDICIGGTSGTYCLSEKLKSFHDRLTYVLENKSW